MTLVSLVVISVCLVLALGKLQPIRPTNYDTDFVYEIVLYLHKQHNFDTFVIYTNSREQTKPKDVVAPSVERVLQDRLGVPVIIWGKHADPSQLSDVIGSNVLVIVFIADLNDPILAHINESLRHKHHLPIIFVFRRIDLVTPTMSELQKFFELCWHRKILNVLLIYEDVTFAYDERGVKYADSRMSHVFGYNPFPSVQVIELTGTSYNATMNLKSVSNVKGHKFRLPFVSFAPLIFQTNFMNNKRLDKPKLTGVMTRLLIEYIEHINGTCEPEEMGNASVQNLSTMASRNEIDIGAIPYSTLDTYSSSTLGSYPIFSSYFCIAVPVVQEIPLSTYMTNFIFGKGNLICLLTVPLICFFKFLTQRHRNPWHLLFESFALFMSQAGSVRPFRYLPPATRVVHVAYLIWSMLVLSVYIGGMASLLTNRSAVHQIETVDDFLATDIKIMLDNNTKKLFFDSKFLPAELVPRIYVVDYGTVHRHLTTLNTSFAYIVNQQYWDYLSIKQAALSIPRLRLASNNLCTPTAHYKYPMQWDSPYWESLKEFTVQARETGLWHRWVKESYFQAKQMGADVQPIKDPPKYRPLTLEHFTGLFIMYFALIGVAILVFIAELIIHKRRG